MLHGGVCVPRQYARFCGTAYGHAVSRFFDKLVARRFAVACDCSHNRAELYHVRHHALYAVIGQPHSRYRRPVPAHDVMNRLMRIDAIVMQPNLTWPATEDEKVALFGSIVPSIGRERLPHVRIGKGANQRERLFPDDHPLGVTASGRVVFTYVITGPSSDAFGQFVERHAELFAGRMLRIGLRNRRRPGGG